MSDVILRDPKEPDANAYPEQRWSHLGLQNTYNALHTWGEPSLSSLSIFPSTALL